MPERYTQPIFWRTEPAGAASAPLSARSTSSCCSSRLFSLSSSKAPHRVRSAGIGFAATHRLLTNASRSVHAEIVVSSCDTSNTGPVSETADARASVPGVFSTFRLNAAVTRSAAAARDPRGFRVIACLPCARAAR